MDDTNYYTRVYEITLGLADYERALVVAVSSRQTSELQWLSSAIDNISHALNEEITLYDSEGRELTIGFERHAFDITSIITDHKRVFSIGGTLGKGVFSCYFNTPSSAVIERVKSSIIPNPA